MKKTNQDSGTLISNLILGLIVVGGLIYLINLTNQNENKISGKTEAKVEGTSNSIEDGKQIINLKAKVGYSPSLSTAKANTPTILRVKTAGTFDCSASITIPSIGIRKNLPPTGSSDIEIPEQEAGTILNGTCSMGMYNFSIKFI